MSNARKNVGIEITRILSMFMVMVLHILYNGGVLFQTSNTGVDHWIAWYLEFLCIIAVNLFGMISGYLLVNSSAKTKRLVSLWLQVLTYSVLISAFVALVFHRFDMNTVESIFPIIFKRYWYFSAYVVLYISIPVLNSFIAGLDEQQYKLVLLVSFIFFSIIATISRTDGLFFMYGYSPLWLAVLYFFGGFFRRFGFPKVSGIKLMSIYLISAGLDTLVLSAPFLSEQKKILLTMAYTNPLNVIGGIAVFILLVRKNNYSNLTRRFALSIGPLSFAAYLVQANPSLFSLYHNFFGFLGHKNILLLISLVLLSSLLFFTISVILEWGRVWVISKMRFGRVSDRLSLWLHQFVELLISGSKN